MESNFVVRVVNLKYETSSLVSYTNIVEALQVIESMVTPEVLNKNIVDLFISGTIFSNSPKDSGDVIFLRKLDEKGNEVEIGEGIFSALIKEYYDAEPPPVG